MHDEMPTYVLDREGVVDFTEFPNDKVQHKKALVLDEKRFVNITVVSSLSPTDHE